LSYPLGLTVAPDEGQNRLWGIPIFGIFVRWILLIPHFILLFFLGLGVFFVALLGWIPVLINGRQANWVSASSEAYFVVSARASVYLALATGTYPPIGWTGDHTVNVSLDRGASQNRLWGIPLLGLYLRWILLIPHFVVIWVLAIVLGLLFLVNWIPVLINGRQAPAIVNFVAGFYRWTFRVAAYALLLTSTYPPFSLND
jgi:hypothetical protein